MFVTLKILFILMIHVYYIIHNLLLPDKISFRYIMPLLKAIILRLMHNSIF